MSEYHTDIVADIKNDSGNNLTGIIATSLSKTISDDKTFGIMKISLEQKLPLFFGVNIAVKSYTNIYLIHSINESDELQLISCKKKGISSSLEGEYKGFCFTIPLRYQNLLKSNNSNTAELIEEIVAIACKQSSKEKRYAWFKMELHPKGRDKLDSDDDDDTSGDRDIRIGPRPTNGKVLTKPLKKTILELA